MDGLQFVFDDRTLAPDAAGPSTPTEQRAAPSAISRTAEPDRRNAGCALFRIYLVPSLSPGDLVAGAAKKA
jgi:hypothetical protein